MFEKLGLSTLIAALCYWLGGWDNLTKTLLFLITADYATGILSAIYQKKLNSKVGFYGILKKVSTLIIVATSVSLENLIGQPNTIHCVVTLLYCGNEFASILENAAKMNIFVPKILREKIATFIEKRDESE